MDHRFLRECDFSQPLDDMWEVIPEKGWSFDMAPRRARFTNTSEDNAEIYLRPCSIPGDTFQFMLAPESERRGVFTFGFIGGFEYIKVELDLATGDFSIRTHEFHKEQPRSSGRASGPFSKIALLREKDDLPGLPYDGSSVKLLLDGRQEAEVCHIDYLPESMFMFGLKGKGNLTLSSFSISGNERPRPEFVDVGIWQQSGKPTAADNVDALIEGVRQAASAGVEILITPETSLTGLRPTDSELENRDLIQSELKRFRKAFSAIENAPFTLIGYPEWVSAPEVDGSTLDRVKINCHRFVRPDGTVGPMMAKVHSCEERLWHGRRYNLQRVRGVEVALGICHDGHYQDVWATGVMGGARLCLHPAAGGTPSGPIAEILNGFQNAGEGLRSYWVHVNAGGGSAIVYPAKNRKYPDTILAVPKDLTKENPTYPEYSPMGDLLAHKRIRLWDADGSYPMRTLRSGKRGYDIWSQLIPEIQEV